MNTGINQGTLYSIHSSITCTNGKGNLIIILCKCLAVPKGNVRLLSTYALPASNLRVLCPAPEVLSRKKNTLARSLDPSIMIIRTVNCSFPEKFFVVLTSPAHYTFTVTANANLKLSVSASLNANKIADCKPAFRPAQGDIGGSSSRVMYCSLLPETITGTLSITHLPGHCHDDTNFPLTAQC